MIKKFTTFIMLCVLLLAGCSHEKETITVSAAASLQDALNEVIDEYETSHEATIDVNYGGSGSLREQIIQGAPVDLFLSASVEDFNKVEDTGRVNDKTDLLKNKLMLIKPTDSDLSSIDTLNHVEKIAIGDPDTVPAGNYALEAFESLDILEDTEDKFIYASDVRAVLTYVSQGEVDAGIVYETDALSEKDTVEIVETFQEHTHEPIVYPLGQLTEDDEVNHFYEYLNSQKALDIFEKYGFTVE